MVAHPKDGDNTTTTGCAPTWPPQPAEPAWSAAAPNRPRCATDGLERLLAEVRSRSSHRRRQALLGVRIGADEIRAALALIYDHRELARAVLLDLLADDPDKLLELLAERLGPLVDALL